MSGDTQPLLDEEQGATDNRMSLSIGEHPDIKDWKDDQEYVFREVRVRQKTPGEFMVISAEAEEPEQSAGDRPYGNEGARDNETGAPEGEEAAPGSTGNPAIDRLMKRGGV